MIRLDQSYKELNNKLKFIDQVVEKWLFYGGYSPLHNFHLIISPIVMTEQKGKRYQRTRSVEVFYYGNTRIDFN